MRFILAILVIALAGFAVPNVQSIDCTQPGEAPTNFTVILPYPGGNIQPGDVVRVENVEGTECYGEVVQDESRHAIAAWGASRTTTEPPQNMGASYGDVLAVRAYRNGELSYEVDTGVYYQPDGIINISYADTTLTQLQEIEEYLLEVDQVVDSLQFANADLQQDVTQLTTERNNLQAQVTGLENQVAELEDLSNQQASAIEALSNFISRIWRALFGRGPGQ